MALVIHRSPSRPAEVRPRLLLIGGDGRWARALLRLIDDLGFVAEWWEHPHDPAWLAKFAEHDLIVAADAESARPVLDHPEPGPALILMTGSLLGLSTPVSARTELVAWPITRANLHLALARSLRLRSRAA